LVSKSLGVVQEYATNNTILLQYPSPTLNRFEC
jgi:hypothetical protein